MISVREIKNDEDLQKAFEIRRSVFVLEQIVDPAEEYDEYENACIHFLASFNGTPCGTARIRKTENGYKLERFAVLKEYRGKQVGAALVKACLEHEWLQNSGTYIYMHAQEHALEFYKKFGFEISGDRFWECEMPHFKMFKKANQ
jgi:predicted GNAT family N-acyltransferase